MNGKRGLAVVVLAAAAALSGCNAWKIQSIESQIKDLVQKQEAVSKKITDRNQAIASLQKESAGLAGKVRARRDKVWAYLGNHKLATACIAAGEYKMKSGNVFSEDIEETITGAALICLGGFFLSEDFQAEVTGVLSELETASDEVKRFQAQIEAIKPKIEAENLALATAQAELSGLAQKISSLQAELSKLKS